jgi:hypothetical protein
MASRAWKRKQINALKLRVVITKKEKTEQLMKNSNTYTAFIVRDATTRRFLNRKVYTGRARGVWDKIGEAQIFYNRQKAQSCASNINARRPTGGSSVFAEVREIELMRRSPQRVS